jgi:hypothetical protein
MSSEYEKAREANIKRNEDFLKNIGLNDLQKEIRVATGARDRPVGEKVKRKRVTRPLGKDEEGQYRASGPQRRSRRLQNPAGPSSSSSSNAVEEETFLFLNDGKGERKINT